MKVIIKNNKVKYKYEKHKLSDKTKLAICFFVTAIFLLFVALGISILYDGDAPTFVSGVVISSLICNAMSMICSILEIYEDRIYNTDIRNMLLLQTAYFIFWILII